MTTTDRSSRIAVVVRAYRDRPVPMVVVSEGPSWVDVARLPGGQTIRMPRSLTFLVTPSDLDEMTKAFDRGQMKTLVDLWGRAAPYAAPIGQPASDAGEVRP